MLTKVLLTVSATLLATVAAADGSVPADVATFTSIVDSKSPHQALAQYDLRWTLFSLVYIRESMHKGTGMPLLVDGVGLDPARAQALIAASGAMIDDYKKYAVQQLSQYCSQPQSVRMAGAAAKLEEGEAASQRWRELKVSELTKTVGPGDLQKIDAWIEANLAKQARAVRADPRKFVSQANAAEFAEHVGKVCERLTH